MLVDPLVLPSTQPPICIFCCRAPPTWSPFACWWSWVLTWMPPWRPAPWRRRYTSRRGRGGGTSCPASSSAQTCDQRLLPSLLPPLLPAAAVASCSCHRCCCFCGDTGTYVSAHLAAACKLVSHVACFVSLPACKLVQSCFLLSLADLGDLPHQGWIHSTALWRGVWSDARAGAPRGGGVPRGCEGQCRQHASAPGCRCVAVCCRLQGVLCVLWMHADNTPLHMALDSLLVLQASALHKLSLQLERCCDAASEAGCCCAAAPAALPLFCSTKSTSIGGSRAHLALQTNHPCRLWISGHSGRSGGPGSRRECSGLHRLHSPAGA